MSITIDLTGFKAQIAAKTAKFQEATRPAAQAAAQVIYEQTRINAPISDHEHFFYGTSFKKTGQRYGPFEPGNLRDSIYQVYSKDKSTDSKAVYHVSWNTKIGAAIKYAPYGAMVEWGTSKAPAQSFLGSAIASQSGAALQAMRTKFVQLVTAA